MMVYYVMLRGIDRFYSEYNVYPGEFEVEPDIIKLKVSQVRFLIDVLCTMFAYFVIFCLILLQSCISKLLNEWGCGTLAKDDYVHEICRYGGAELHSVSSFIGKACLFKMILFYARS